MPLPEHPSLESLRERAHRLIPAGAHTYSKGDDQFPANAPAFLDRGSGAYVWDPDGREFIDWGMGLRAVVLGHAYPPVIAAAHAQIDRGANFVRPAPIEADCAEALLGLLPSAEMVKFAKNGSDVTTAAIRLARAHTGRRYIAMCRDNPFYSFDDWFIGTTAMNSGVPDETTAQTLPFRYGDIADLERLFDEHPNDVACIIVEPVALAPAATAECATVPVVPSECPHAHFLRQLRAVATKRGAVLIFDEMISGFRWHNGGAQVFYDVEPDLSCFGKGLGNGFSVSALTGRREIMELGGIRQRSRPRTFLLSATHGGETHALAAARAVIEEYAAKPVIEHIWRMGRLLQDGLRIAAAAAGLNKHIKVDHYPCSPSIRFLDSSGSPSSELRTVFLYEMVARGILIPYVAPSYSHTEALVDQTVDAAHAAFQACARALDAGLSESLNGAPVKPVFRSHV